jgi:Reverse transcriptase (RNA-dependent DNA polymerase)
MVTTPMDLFRSPASFQHLMETMVHSLPNIIVYIDGLLLHSSSHPEHLKQLDLLLQQRGIKINLPKCKFGSKEVAYLEFRIFLGVDKLKAVSDLPLPTNVHKVIQFLGLWKFFGTHVQNFTQISSALTALMKKDCQWKGSPSA